MVLESLIFEGIDKNMKVFAFVGPSGTGKSYRAQMVASERNINFIIDDGLLINENEVVAGVSANSTDLCIFFSPNASTTFLCLGEAPIVLLVNVIFNIAIMRYLLT